MRVTPSFARGRFLPKKHNDRKTRTHSPRRALNTSFCTRGSHTRPKLQYRGFAASTIVTMLPPGQPTHTPSLTSILTLWDAEAASNRAQPRHLTASSCTAKAYLRLALGLPRLRLAPAARWPVGLRTARWIAATPFLKHAGHAHGNVGDLTSASSAILASPRQASEL